MLCDCVTWFNSNKQYIYLVGALVEHDLPDKADRKYVKLKEMTKEIACQALFRAKDTELRPRHTYTRRPTPYTLHPTPYTLIPFP